MASILDLITGGGNRQPTQQGRDGFGSLDQFLMRQFQDDDEDEDENYDPAAPIVVSGQTSQRAPQEPVAVEETQPPRQMRDYEADFGPGYKPPEHKGRFGTKGILRDVLGTLGDAFLVQSGNKPMYSAKRQMENEGDAMVGFSRNPLAAIERLAQENPDAARDMYKAYQTNALGLDNLEFKRDQFRDQAPDREALRAGRQATMQRTTLGNARTAISSVSSPAQWEKLTPKLKERLGDAGLGEWAELIPDRYDPDVQYLFMDPKDLAAMEDRDALRNQQMAIARLRDKRAASGQAIQSELGKERNRISDRNATTAEKRAANAGKGKKSYDFGPPPPGFTIRK